MEKRVLLLLFVVALVTIVYGQGDPLLPSKQAFERQVKLYNELMDGFLANVEKTTITLDRVENGQTKQVEFELYKIGKNDMELKTVFDLLQNWHPYVDKLADKKGLQAGTKDRTDFIQKQRYFELNIGGDDYTFGIELTGDTKEIIIVGKDGTAPPYSDLYKTFTKSEAGMQNVAKELLHAADSTVSNQPKWTDTIKDPKVMDDMRMFSVISQIAEGARPSEAFFKEMTKVNEELISTRVASFEKVDAVLKKNMYEPISSIVKSDEFNVKTYSQYRDFVTVIEQAQFVLEKIKLKKTSTGSSSEAKPVPPGEESLFPPEQRNKFFEELRGITLDKTNRALKDLLKKYGLSYKDKKITKLVTAVKNLQTTPEGATNVDLEKAVEDTLTGQKGRGTKKIPLSPEAREEFFKELRNIDVTQDDKQITRDVKGLLEKYDLTLIKANEFKNLISNLKALQNPPADKTQADIEKDIDDALTVHQKKISARESLEKEFANLNREITEKILKTLKITQHNDEFFTKLTDIDLADTSALKSFLKSLKFETEGADLDGLVDAVKKLKEESSKPESVASQAALRKAVEDALPPVSKKFCEDLSTAARQSHAALKDNTFKYYNEKVLPEVEGRIPGAGDLVRYLLKQLETGKLNSFEDVSRVSVFLEVNGLIPSRIQAIEQFSFSQDQIKVAYDNAIESLHLKTSAVLDNMQETATELIGATCSNYHAPLMDKYLDDKRSQLIAAASLFTLHADESCRINDEEELVEDSVKWKGDHLEFETIDKEGVKKFHERKFPLEENEFSKYLHEEVESKGHLSKKFGAGLGVYGTFVAILGSIKQFEDGNYGQGALSAVQALHSIGGLTGLNEKLSRKLIEKSLNFAAEKFATEKVLAKLSEPLAEGLGKAGKVFSRFLEDIPFVGLGFDIYFITEDIKDLMDKKSKTPKFLKVAHLILDVETTILSLVGTFVPEAEPIIEPIIIVLTVIRITIDDFYTDIKYELDKAKGKGFGARVRAFFKGFGEGVADVFTLGLVNQLNQLNDAAERDKELFKNMKNPENYFNETLANKGQVNFNGGTMSQYGGFISVTLNDDGSFTMELPEVYTGETPRKVKKTFKFKMPAKDIVLGLGTTVSPQYIHKTAKLWLLIPVKSYDIVGSFLDHNSSRYGTYYGNKYNNNFYAVQQASISSDYHYNLHGRDGDDKFFLGPQTSFVLGGDGQDIYFIQPTGGRATIDNFALDENMDTLYINISYSELKCYREESNLVVVNNVSTAVFLNHWFLQGERHDYFRHITITTNDGIEIDVTNTSISGNEHRTICNVASVNKARSKQDCTVDLRDDTFEEAKRVVGSNFSDTIFGNEKDNLLIGGLGNDIISGGNGADKYFIRKGDGVDTIDNYSKDKKMDTIIFGVDYVEISLQKQGNDLVLLDSTAPQETKLIIRSWFKNQDYQHANFMSKDYIIFLVTSDGNSVTKDAITIDLSKKSQGVTVDLQNQTLNSGITLSSEAMRDVKLLIDSPHDDRLVGNTRNNIMSCSGGTDHLQGNAGSDTYVVKQTCKGVKILNYDDLGKPQYDLLMFSCESSKIRMSVSGTDLLMRCIGRPSLDVALLKWFESSLYQHLMVKTQDKWTFLPPEEEENFSSAIEPYQIETTESCNGQTRTFNLNTVQFQHVQRLKANSSLCEYIVIGNSLNNYFDLGPSNSYGFRALEGGNGSDTYVFGYRYGVNNHVNNYATDGQYDHLQLDVIFEYLHVTLSDENVIISSTLANNSVGVKILNYLKGSSYQHLLIQSSDGVYFQIKMVEYAPVKEIAMVKYSKSPFSQIISALDDKSLTNVREIIGSETAMNSIYGGPETMKITGGNQNDRIFGGSFSRGEDIEGMDGDDYIDGKEGDDNISGGNGNDVLIGGDGNDVIYGGKGADTIRGGHGSDTVVFSGSVKNKTGVFVNLQSGTGFYADAYGDKYESIENILGSEFNDNLIGDDDNNLISGYAGDDYIMAAGGMDNLKGGLDSDIYDMKNAFGLKVINNFATDTKADTLLLSDSSREQMCYYYNGDDLYINIDYGNDHVRGAMGRAILGEGLLEIKLVSWLSNITYQHLQIIFSNGSVLNGRDLSEDGRQMSSMVHGLLNKTTGIPIVSVNETTVVLSFNLQFINKENPLPSDTELIWVHSGHNKTKRYPVNVDTSTNSAMLTVNELKHGIKQLFYVMIQSCNVTVAVSPLTVVTIPPNPPVNVTIHPVIPGIDGFTVHWLPPDQSTDPNAFYYYYTIKYWQRDTPNKVTIIEHDNFLVRIYTAFNLVPNTYYELAIASMVGNITGTFSSPVTIHTGYTSCINFFNLPNNSHIGNVESHKGRLVASIYCDRGYQVNGTKYVECNDTSTPIPQCVLLHCDLPSEASYNAVQATGSQRPVDGDNVIWKCSDRMRTTSGGKYFSSTCIQGIWDPPLRPCVPEPSCPRYPPLSNGNVDPPFAYLNESITFSCLGDYTRRGPEKKVCRSRSGSRAVSQPQSDLYYHPTTPVQCVRLPCPELLPQPHGKYKITSDGNVAELTCNNGYFVSITDSTNPEKQTLRCTKQGTWSVQQKICQPMLEGVQATGTRNVYGNGELVGNVRFRVPQWRSRSSLPGNLNQVACYVLGLDTFISKTGLAVKCRVKFRLTDNPPLDNGKINPYRGKLTWINRALGTSEKICVEYDFLGSIFLFFRITFEPFKLCRWLGLGRNYRVYAYASISAKPFRTTKTMRINIGKNLVQLKDETKMCKEIVSCRATCEPLRLDSAVNWCDKTLEGESCSFRCRPGSALLGSPTRTCSAYGTWSGDNNNCDAEKWKADIDRIGKDHRHNRALQNVLYDHLTRTYPGVSWLVMVYAPVTGFDKHTMIYYTYNLYLKFRYYGNNIVVGRILSSPSSHNFGLPRKLDNAVSPYLRGHFNDMGPLVDKTWNKIRADNRYLNVRTVFAFRKRFIFFDLGFAHRQSPDTRIYVKEYSINPFGKVVVAVVTNPWYYG